MYVRNDPVPNELDALIQQHDTVVAEYLELREQKTSEAERRRKELYLANPACSKVDQIIQAREAYVAALERGERLSWTQWCDRYPDLDSLLFRMLLRNVSMAGIVPALEAAIEYQSAEAEKEQRRRGLHIEPENI